MHVVLTVIFVLEIATAITRTEAIPNWSWSAKNKHKQRSHHHSEAHDICAVGQCVKAWTCPEAAIAAVCEEDSCIYRENGPWVCCLVNDDESHHWEDTNIQTSETSNNPKHIIIKSLHGSATSNTEKRGHDSYDGAHKPFLKDTWNRNAEKDLPHINPLGDILKNDREKYPIYIPRNKTVGTKVPYINITNIIAEGYDKSTSSTNYKRTTNFWNKPGTSTSSPKSTNIWEKSRTSTTSPNYHKRTTNLWDKFRTSTSSPNYYKSTTNLWDKSRTSTSSSNYYKSTTDLWDKFRTSTSSPNYYKSTTNLWDKSRTSTPSPNYHKRTTNLWDKSRTSTSSPNYYKSTTNLWDKSRTSESRIIFPSERVTKYTTPSSPTKRIFNNESTKSSRTQSTSTKTSWGYTTAYNRRTHSTTTKHPYFKKPTESTKTSTRKNQNSGSSTTVHPARNQPTKSRTPSSIRTTIKSTRRYSTTTPLPNVNIHLCGLRDERTTTRRRIRDDNYARKPVADAFYSGNIHSRSRLPYQRIVGGEEAEPFSWPWVAALYKVTSSGGNRFLSAGTLINENFILTAAHVFTPDDLRSASYVVMLGTHDAQDALAQYIVSSVLLHPKYEHRYYYNDIALLKLERKVSFNDYIMPVCLPSPSAPLHADKDLLGKNVTVMGWGDDSFGGKSSQVLKEATFPIVSRISCNASYVRVASNRFPKGITADMLCAGDPKGGKDACQGDSGGPLTVIENRRYTQVGIVSFGYKCGDKEFPGVYTKVAPYLTWIAENTKFVDDYTNYDY